MRTHALLWLVLVPLTLTGAARAASAPSADQILSMSLAPEAIEARLARYVPVDLGIDDARAAKELEAVLRPLRRAADFVDHAYWQQRSREGLAMVEALEASRKPSAKNLARLLRIEYGPWDWHANDEPFIGRHARPDGLAFYPSDLSRWEFEAWIDAHPGSIDGFWSPYTVVQRKNGSLEAVPYSKAYQTDLIAAAVALREAAEATDCQSLAAYLRARATSLTTDEYRASEFLWLAHHDCPLDIAIGPYEFYGDRLMGLKTTLGAIIYRQRPRDSERYARVLEAFDGLTANLPIDASLASRFVTTKPSPIMVADVLYTSGDFRAGYQARAFLLPNDEVVRERAGTRNVILQNVVRAKFDKLVLPVAKRLLAPGDVPKVSADVNTSLVGRKLHEVNQESRDRISEDPELTAWRRSLRSKFNTEEGAALARQNSLLMAEQRAEERRVRKGLITQQQQQQPAAAAGAAEAAAPAAGEGEDKGAKPQ